MQHAHVRFANRVGVAPGTTTLSYLGQAPGDDFPYVNPPSPTQAVYEPDPNNDNVRIALPPNQWVTGPVTMKVMMPAVQKTFGPVINDRQAATMRPYFPVRKGWIDNATGEPVYTLQGGGGLGELSTGEKWAITASVLSAVALATTTVLAVLKYRKGK